MASPASPEPFWRPSLGRTLAYLLAGTGAAALSLLLLHLLVGRRLAQQLLIQTGSEVASNLVLGEVALERFSPEVLGQISGLPLVISRLPEPAAFELARRDRLLRWQTQRLQAELCRRLGRCPAVRPASLPRRGVWVEMASPLEPVWLFVPLPSPRGWPPDPLLLSLSVGLGGLGALLLFLTLEIQRPLTRLQEALADVGLEALPAALPDQGAPAVRQLMARFNAMLVRLEDSGRERTTMLAGIAHDLRSPLTRLRLRLALAAEGPMAPQELERAQADIRSIERITRQFMIFAGAESGESPVLVPLDALVAEAAAAVGEVPLELDLEPLVRRVRPIALARAVGNLLDNALTYGRPPLRVVLRPLGPGDGVVRPHSDAGPVESGFEIQVWDCGEGIDPQQWQKAMTPFQRLDQARGGEGHCGLGLAIAAKVARDHGGDLRRLEAPATAEPLLGRFGVVLRAWPLPGD
ncbi:HAMP domain-containing sensor histidine kinase [Synechococcus sp. CS-1332]|uniref:sensor histidine kinase n=1 Tax=Synechococcus sp. CS-1332 TaxID=2847972 RepID=UPI00223BF61B|nr:ATP-binding protein [Synechococcus sp. CS-1332]MCT0208788.1 histidine kinase [Synechococcus sp. CS-1332]